MEEHQVVEAADGREELGNLRTANARLRALIL